MKRIAVDSSALLAVLFIEKEAPRCADILASAKSLVISSVTLAEVEIVADRRGVRGEFQQLIAQLKPQIVPVALTEARLAVDAYASWGKGVHPAALNFVDCFAYILAKSEGCPLLYVGNDFARTDIQSA